MTQETVPAGDPWEVTGPDDAGVSSLTRDWWEMLPRFVREADAAQRPIPVPLLRFLDGVGSQADASRALADDLWSGVGLTPEGARSDLLQWIAYLLGMGEAERDLEEPLLRSLLAHHVQGGTHNVGTRVHIADAIRPFLAPGARVQVRASVGEVNTLVIGVNPEDALDGVEELIRRIRRAGVVPAGHALIVQDVRATWDEWEAAAGTTWDEVEMNIRTWQDSDTAGVDLY